MPDPALLEIDVHRGEGAALLTAVRTRHGEAIAQAAMSLHRLFIMRSPWAPGLRFVGGELEVKPPSSAMAEAHRFSVGGASSDLVDAFASCVAEGVERVSCVERAGDVVIASRVEVADRVMQAARQPIDEFLTQSNESELGWVSAKLLADSAEVIMPADWCLRRARDGPLRMPGTALSTGVAAGQTYEVATVRALLELVERDAASLWWIGGRRGRQPALDDADIADAIRILVALRDGNEVRRTWLLDITTELKIPTFAALSVDGTGRGLCCGLAARLTMGEAARGALLEMCQMELGLLVAIAKRRSGGDASLADPDRRHLLRADALDADRIDLLHPAAPPRHMAPTPTDIRPLWRLRNTFAEHNIEAALVDLSRPELGIPVVRAIAPQLQPMPATGVTQRLATAIAATGSNAGATRNVPLF